MRTLSAVLELAGYLAVLACLYLLNPILLLGTGGLVAIGIGLALSRAQEKPE